MKRTVLLILCLFAFKWLSAQPELSDYSFVVVPEKFEFLYEEDQHQLNSMTKFLFNKYGFNAYYETELPNVRRCDGLWANVEGSPGFVWTRLQVVIRDCYGTEVYRSSEGQSKYKEYRKAYQDALRSAFESIAVLGVKQPPLDDLKELEQKEVGMVAEPEDAAATTTSNRELSPFGLEFIPDTKFSNYTHDGVNYLLRRTASGYSFYQEVEEAEDGLVLIGRITQKGKALEYKAENGAETRMRFLEGGHLELSNPDGSTIYRYAGQ